MCQSRGLGMDLGFGLGLCMGLGLAWPRDGPWPDPSLLLTLSKNEADPLTWPEDTFLDPKGKKLKNLTFLGEIFQTQTQTINGWPDLTRATKNWPYPGQKFLTRLITSSVPPRHILAKESNLARDESLLKHYMILKWKYHYMYKIRRTKIDLAFESKRPQIIDNNLSWNIYKGFEIF